MNNQPVIVEKLRDPLPRPERAGIGLRACHHLQVLSDAPNVAWFEAHTENYLADGGAHVEVLAQIRSDYRLSLHGVGLSLGSSDALDLEHLAKVRRAVERFDPFLVSEHLSWSSIGGRFANDLLPLPYTEEALAHISARIRQVQDFLGRQILVENVSSYLQFESSQLTEWDFLASVASQSGCGLLLDLNNIYVSACNHHFDPYRYLAGIDPSSVQEIHLAGHSSVVMNGHNILIDTHAAPVCDAVWAIYEAALRRFGARPTLIEWDTAIPALDVLMQQAERADSHRAKTHVLAA